LDHHQPIVSSIIFISLFHLRRPIIYERLLGEVNSPTMSLRSRKFTHFFVPPMLVLVLHPRSNNQSCVWGSQLAVRNQTTTFLFLRAQVLEGDGSAVIFNDGVFHGTRNSGVFDSRAIAGACNMLHTKNFLFRENIRQGDKILKE
jgi:hypothetical protein